jgi:hypothetical protein
MGRSVCVSIVNRKRGEAITDPPAFSILFPKPKISYLNIRKIHEK